MKTIQLEISDQLLDQLRSLIEAGWFESEGELLQEALRRFLETHKSELMERHIREDVEWGLDGSD